MEHLSEAARSNQGAIRGSQEEIVEYRRQLQSRTIELETLRGTKESLERQCVESEDRHHDDLNSLQAGNAHKHPTCPTQAKPTLFSPPFFMTFDL